MSWLVVSAAEFECRELLASMPKGTDYMAVGVGALNAAKSAKALGERAGGRDVLFVGTCGIFGTFTVPKVFVVDSVYWSPVCERHALAYSVRGSANPIQLKKTHQAFDHLPLAIAHCSPTISLTDDGGRLREIFESSPDKSQVENLELYSVATEIESVARSFSTLLATTNAVGPESHAFWRSNFRQAAQLTAVTIIDCLQVSDQHVSDQGMEMLK